MLTDYVWVDYRWQEPHWLEAFRMRLCGWLPADITADAISNGLFLKVHASDEARVVLTERARRLTDLAVEAGENSPNCVMLANVLITRGFDRNWLNAEKHADGSLLQENQIFPKAFRDNILFEVASMDLVNE